jgi:AmmeMemoRadiSam system protein B
VPGLAGAAAVALLGAAAISAAALAPLVDDKTLVVASTDLSHYHPYDEAKDKRKENDNRQIVLRENVDVAVYAFAEGI